MHEKIISYLDRRILIHDLHPELLGQAKPKHHYAVHYPQFILEYGPAIHYMTARFESRHRLAKSTAESGIFIFQKKRILLFNVFQLKTSRISR